ncbi:MAG: adenosylcobinamide-GDP ribazoletransferase [Candidatus Coatesbacteria bacterium]|nr:MAG: adenosylcobinamide-GDP ribazoletransferase [Candidatus Coatesbacteria bacterium]
MRSFLAAVRFLTIIPLPGRSGSAEAELAGSAVYFPIVGLLIGAGAAGTAVGLTYVLPALPAAVLLVVLLAAVSGGLHLDGLSDTADGFLSARPRERILEIMKDSQVGAMGVIVIVCVLLLKVVCLARIPRVDVWRAALLMPLAGRSALVISMAVLPYARPQGGLGSAFYRLRPRVSALFALALLLTAGWLACQWPGVAAAGASVLVVLIFCVWCYRKIGGATGDTLGAACEIAEVVPSVVMVGWYFRSGNIL